MAEGWGLPRRERSQDHNRPNTPEWLRFKRCTAPVCRYYARGACAYAEKCRFLHVEPPPRAQQNGAIDHSKTGKAETTAHPKRKDKNLTAPAAPKEENKSGEKSCTAEDRVNAPEFYPLSDWGFAKAPKTYVQAVSSLTNESVEGEKATPLCPCNKQERDRKNEECIKKHERDMEISFAIQKSKDKTCGICFEVIMEKALWDQKFGILPNCNHCFCLTCIRKWRQAKNFDSEIIRACPECRVSSDFVCPCSYWVDNKEDKEKLIVDYKDALSSKHCKYFLRGRGKCPFGNKCFYLHAYPDGTKADVGPPVRQRRQNADGETEVFQHIFLWDFLEDQDNQWRYSIEAVDDIFAFFSDSDDSDWSDYDIFL